MASRIKKSFGSCEKTASREMDAISRVGFDDVNKLMLVTWFSPLPVLCLFPKLLRAAMKVEGEESGETVNKAGTVTAEARGPHGQKGSGQCCFECGD